MSSNSDETYLEAFIESLATLPLEVRRNMELLHDLDVTCSSNLMLLQREQRQYIHQAEEKILQLEIVQMETEPEEATTATNDGLLSANNTNSYGVRIKGNDDDDSNNTNQHQNDNPVVVIPTTDELFAYTYQPDSYNRIRRLQQECLQYSEEKVSIAKQVYEQMEAQVERLDRDVKDMEQLLQAQGVSPTATLARPNDLAACQVEPGNEWILAKVLQHDPVAGSFKLADEDAESNKIFDLPEQQVVVLNTLERLSKGDMVFAVYPDTTSFYPATVVQAPRKNQSSTNLKQLVMVNFVDDSDEFGVTHDKAVPLQHVMPPPYDA